MSAAFGLYTHIRANRRRSIALMAGLFALVAVLVFAVDLILGGYVDEGSLEQRLAASVEHTLFSLPFAALAVGLWLGIAWLFHQSLIDGLTGGRPVERREAPEVYDMLENLCISRGMTMPRFEIMETDTPNAFASGVNEKQYTITLTRGLINMLSDDEMEAVIAHELTHIRNGDVRMMIFAMIIAGVIAFFAELLFRWLLNSRSTRSSSRNSDSKGGGGMAIMIAVTIVAVAWFLSIVIRFSLSRSREYLADAGSVELTKNPDAMISALRKIEAHGAIPTMPSRMHAFFIESPARVPESGWLSTHPTVDERVRELIDFAGGHDVALAAPEARGPWG